MRTAKILSILAGGIMVLAAGLLAVWLSVNPNDYKGRIAAAVKQSTGRDLNLGRIHLSVFPWVALERGPGSLGNPPGSGGEPFLVFAQAGVRARLIPLLRKRLEVGGQTVAVPAFAPRVGMELPKTCDPRALAELSASGEFGYDAHGIRFNTQYGQLDDTHLQADVQALVKGQLKQKLQEVLEKNGLKGLFSK